MVDFRVECSLLYRDRVDQRAQLSDSRFEARDADFEVERLGLRRGHFGCRGAWWPATETATRGQSADIVTRLSCVVTSIKWPS
jgi:hypothetical protein